MAEITSAHLVEMFGAIADAMVADKERLCALDGVIGDADHGIAMELGFNAIRQSLNAMDATAAEPTAIFNAAAKSFLNAVGASSGPLYATAFMRAGAAVKDKQKLDSGDIVKIIQAMAQGIKDRGKAEPGEKTMMDAWGPASLAAPEGLAAALAAATQGAESTKAMLATKGRAARLGERSLGHMDPGAASAVTVIAAMGKVLALPAGGL
jgi:phosphoenolpyruvate---glycerone phosphotransferase subunit DhaL